MALILTILSLLFNQNNHIVALSLIDYVFAWHLNAFTACRSIQLSAWKAQTANVIDFSDTVKGDDDN